MPPALVVVAAVITRGDAFLLTRRMAGTHFGGSWEFPGGKCGQGETLADCLKRELREELDVDVVVGEEILRIPYSYPDRDVDLHFFRCAVRGTPRPLLGQAMEWVRRDDLRSLELPPADAELVERLCSGPER